MRQQTREVTKNDSSARQCFFSELALKRELAINMVKLRAKVIWRE